MWPAGPEFDMLERIGDYSCQNHLSSRDKPFWLRIPARLSTNAGESGLCAALALKGSGKPLEQRKHAPLGNGACSVRIPAYSWIHAWKFLQLQVVPFKYSTSWVYLNWKSHRKGFLLVFVHSTDPQSLTKIQTALKTKRLFLSWKLKTSDSKTLNGTDTRLIVVFIWCKWVWL